MKAKGKAKTVCSNLIISSIMRILRIMLRLFPSSRYAAQLLRQLTDKPLRSEDQFLPEDFSQLLQIGKNLQRFRKPFVLLISLGD